MHSLKSNCQALDEIDSACKTNVQENGQAFLINETHQQVNSLHYDVFIVYSKCNNTRLILNIIPYEQGKMCIQFRGKIAYLISIPRKSGKNAT